MKQFTSSLIHLPESLAIVTHYCVVNMMLSFLFPLRLRREGTMAHNNGKTHNKISIFLGPVQTRCFTGAESKFNELSSCEVRRLNQFETADIIRIGLAVLHAWLSWE